MFYIYICYYKRLINEIIRGKFDFELQKIILKIVNVYSERENDESYRYDLFDKIKNEKLKLEFRKENIEHFSDLLKIEEDFLLEQIELNKGISKNELLKSLLVNQALVKV